MLVFPCLHTEQMLKEEFSRRYSFFRPIYFEKVWQKGKRKTSCVGYSVKVETHNIGAGLKLPFDLVYDDDDDGYVEDIIRFNRCRNKDHNQDGAAYNL